MSAAHDGDARASADHAKALKNALPGLPPGDTVRSPEPGRRVFPDALPATAMSSWANRPMNGGRPILATDIRRRWEARHRGGERPCAPLARARGAIRRLGHVGG